MIIAHDTLIDSHGGTTPATRGGGATRTFRHDEFQVACGELMWLVERDYTPTLMVGVRTGGLAVAEAMARAASSPLPVLPLTSRRPGTKLKSLVPGLQTILSSLPVPLLDAMRQAEHMLISDRRKHATRPRVDPAEAVTIANWLEDRPRPHRVLVVDDAVDSGNTLAAVLGTLRRICPPATPLRAAAITVTLPNPIVEPDYALYAGVLCRFPWSFDAAA